MFIRFLNGDAFDAEEIAWGQPFNEYLIAANPGEKIIAPISSVAYVEADSNGEIGSWPGVKNVNTNLYVS